MDLLRSHANVFVETGTFHGGGVNRALQAGFSKIISIEIHEPLYVENLTRFKDEIAKERVFFYCGDSSKIMQDIVSRIDDPILFWFDAHDQTMNNAGVGELKCPIIQELLSIIGARSLVKRRLDTLLIDDFRLIVKPNWDVDLKKLYEILWEYNPDFRLTRERGYQAHDILKCEYKYLKN